MPMFNRKYCVVLTKRLRYPIYITFNHNKSFGFLYSKAKVLESMKESAQILSDSYQKTELDFPNDLNEGLSKANLFHNKDFVLTSFKTTEKLPEQYEKSKKYEKFFIIEKGKSTEFLFEKQKGKENEAEDDVKIKYMKEPFSKLMFKTEKNTPSSLW